VERLGREAVVDTSVVVKFFVTEQDSEKAAVLLQACLSDALRLVTLDFLFMEFISALWSKTRQRELTVEEARARITGIQRLAAAMEIVPGNEILLESFKAACDYGHPVCDAAFLALADKRAIPLVTADSKFYNKIRRSFPRAVLLSDLQI